jgi:hypothetical protein
MLKEIIKIGDKSYIKAKVVMLPTNEKANIQKNELNEVFNLTYPQHSNQGYISQHLYITSDEEIKESEYGIDIRDNKIFICERLLSNCYECGILQYQKSYCHKIIATTDTSLGLPQPSPQFIHKYIEEYNKGNIINDIMVEYETKLEWTYSHSGRKIQEEGNPFLKVDKNNQITITKVKDSWSRDEVIDLCRKSHLHGEQGALKLHDETFKDWVEENL